MAVRLTLISVILLILAAPVAGQISLYDFSGGLNTAYSWALVGQNQAYQCSDWVLDEPVGALRPRPGYAAVSDSLDHYDHILGFHVHRFLNGETFMFQALRRDTSHASVDYYWSDLYVTDANGFNATDSLEGMLYPSARFSFVSWLDNIYVFNGINPPTVVRGGPTQFTADPLVPKAPGQPNVYPYDIADGPLDGDYMYAILTEMPCSSGTRSKRPGPLSVPIRFDQDQAWITGFEPILADSVCPRPADDSLVWYWILRTRGDAVNFDLDSLFVIDSIQRPNGSTDTIVYVDTLHDSLLTASNLWRTIIQRYDTADYVSELSWAKGGKNMAYAHGSMTLAYSDSGTCSVCDTCEVLGGDNLDTLSSGVTIETPYGEIHLVPSLSGHYANFYTYSLFYPKLGRESDTARSLMIWRGTVGEVDSNLTLYVPPAPDTGVYRIIYRAHLAPGLHGKPNSFGAKQGQIMGYSDQIYYAIDTLYDNADTVYWDTICPVTVELTAPVYAGEVPQDIFKGAVIHEGRMFAWTDHRVYGSVSDTAGRYPFAESWEFDLDDGDEIQQVASYEGMLVVYKTRSVWLLYTAYGEVTARRKASRGVGMIAPWSLTNYRGGNVYLDRGGVQSEFDSPRRTNKLVRSEDYLSAPISDLILRDPADMALATGHIFGQRYLLSYPGTDSTFVYHFRTGAWCPWSFDMEFSQFHDTTATPGLNELLFTKPDDERVFRLSFDYSDDDGADFAPTWEKRYLGREAWDRKTVQRVAVHTTPGLAATDSLVVHLADQDGDSLGVMTLDSLSQSIRSKYTSPTGNRSFLSLRMKIVADNNPNLRLWGLDVQLAPAGLE